MVYYRQAGGYISQWLRAYPTTAQGRLLQMKAGNMSHKTQLLALVIVAGLFAQAGQGQIRRIPAKPTQAERIDRALQAGVKYLLSQLTPEGPAVQEPPAGVKHHGGYTAVTAYALIAAEADTASAPLDKTLSWLMKLDLNGTYAVAFRASALAEWNHTRGLGVLKRDVNWLLNAHGTDGSYHYSSQAKSDDGGYDNSNSQIAVLGMWAAAQREINVPKSYWRIIEQHWVDEQLADGGWNYNAQKSRKLSYGSMTAAGLATMFITFDALHGEDYVRTGKQKEYLPIARGLRWLGENFSVERNPKHAQWKYYWLYSLERVGLASGYKYFGEHDWFAEGVEELLSMQNANGSWGTDKMQLPDTAFAVLFLTRGRYPVLANKLKYNGRWNSRPRDMANLTRWLSWNFERPVAWQIVDMDSPASDWHDAPILYISGSKAHEFTDEQIRKFRTFIRQGGMILSESAGNSGAFTRDMQNTYRQMFPDLQMQRLPDDHPAYKAYFQPKDQGGLLGLSNGVRLLAIHSPRELSLDLQLGYKPARRPQYELATNLSFMASDKGQLPPRGTSHWPAASKFAPAATVRVTRVKFAGNWDPEPLAWRRLAILLGNRYHLNLRVEGPVDLADLDAAKHPIAVMTGEGTFQLTDAQIASLKKFFQDGGTLIVDAAGGSRDFDRAVYQQILELPQNASYSPLPREHQIYRWPEDAKKVSYRRGFAMTLGDRKHKPRLRGVYSDGRLAIVYSRDDLTAGLVGYQFHGIRGYAPDSAVALMTNIICYVADLKDADAAE